MSEQLSIFSIGPDETSGFSGAEYVEKFDGARLTGQLLKIYQLMQDGNWRTLAEIEASTGAPAASASAQLRNLRKERFGSHVIERRSRGDRELGLFEYRLLAQ